MLQKHAILSIGIFGDLCWKLQYSIDSLPPLFLHLNSKLHLWVYDDWIEERLAAEAYLFQNCEIEIHVLPFLIIFSLCPLANSCLIKTCVLDYFLPASIQHQKIFMYQALPLLLQPKNHLKKNHVLNLKYQKLFLLIDLCCREFKSGRKARK